MNESKTHDAMLFDVDKGYQILDTFFTPKPVDFVTVVCFEHLHC